MCVDRELSQHVDASYARFIDLLVKVIPAGGHKNLRAANGLSKTNHPTEVGARVANEEFAASRHVVGLWIVLLATEALDLNSVLTHESLEL